MRIIIWFGRDNEDIYDDFYLDYRPHFGDDSDAKGECDADDDFALLIESWNVKTQTQIKV